MFLTSSPRKSSDSPRVHVALGFGASELDRDADQLKQEVRRELDGVGLQREVRRVAGSDGGMLERVNPVKPI